MNEPPEMTWIEYGILGAEYVRKDVSDAKVAAAVKAEREAITATLYSLNIWCSELPQTPEWMDGVNDARETFAAAIRARGGDDA